MNLSSSIRLLLDDIRDMPGRQERSDPECDQWLFPGQTLIKQLAKLIPGAKLQRRRGISHDDLKRMRGKKHALLYPYIICRDRLAGSELDTALKELCSKVVGEHAATKSVFKVQFQHRRFCVVLVQSWKGYSGIDISDMD